MLYAACRNDQPRIQLEVGGSPTKHCIRHIKGAKGYPFLLDFYDKAFNVDAYYFGSEIHFQSPGLAFEIARDLTVQSLKPCADN